MEYAVFELVPASWALPMALHPSPPGHVCWSRWALTCWMSYRHSWWDHPWTLPQRFFCRSDGCVEAGPPVACRRQWLREFGDRNESSSARHFLSATRAARCGHPSRPLRRAARRGFHALACRAADVGVGTAWRRRRRDRGRRAIQQCRWWTPAPPPPRLRSPSASGGASLPRPPLGTTVEGGPISPPPPRALLCRRQPGTPCSQPSAQASLPNQVATLPSFTCFGCQW